MRGRKPKPLEQRLAEGDTRKVGVRKLREQIEALPRAGRGLPDCPEHIQGLARATWEFWRVELEAMNLDCRPDAMMLEGACVAYARAVEADELITEQGIVIEIPVFDKQGNETHSRTINNPALITSNAAWKNVKAFCSEFGLSPASRTRLTLDKRDDAEDELMQLLSSPRKPRAEKVQ